VLEAIVPNRVDPVTKSIDEVITCATIVVAVKVFLTIKLSAEDAVFAKLAYDAVNTNDAVCALDALRAYEADTALNVNDAVCAFEALNAYEAEATAPNVNDDVKAYDALPNNDPVNEVAQTFPLTVRVEPVGVFIPIPILPEADINILLTPAPLPASNFVFVAPVDPIVIVVPSEDAIQAPFPLRGWPDDKFIAPPTMSNLNAGAVVPIPTLPLPLTNNVPAPPAVSTRRTDVAVLLET